MYLSTIHNNVFPTQTVLERIRYKWPLLLTWINFNPGMVSNHMPGKVWDEITYPSLNFNDGTVEV